MMVSRKRICKECNWCEDKVLYRKTMDIEGDGGGGMMIVEGDEPYDGFMCHANPENVEVSAKDSCIHWTPKDRKERP